MKLTPHTGERRFVVDNVAWCVYETVAPSPCGSSLIFEAEKVARRVHEYPANWRELSDVDLYALSWGR